MADIDIKGAVTGTSVSLLNQVLQVAPGQWVAVVTSGVFTSKDIAKMVSSAMQKSIAEDITRISGQGPIMVTDDTDAPAH